MGAQDKNKIYERLTATQIDALHQKFLDGIAARAQQALPACSDDFSSDARAAMGEKLREMLLLAKRCRKDIAPKKLDEYVAGGSKAIKKQIGVYQKELKKDPWSWGHRRALNKEFNKRIEAPLVSKTFGDAERVYLKIKPLRLEENIVYRDVKRFLEGEGYRIDDYIKGYAVDKAGKQRFKIGKLLKERPGLLDLFVRDDARSSVPKYVVISRNKQDLERMSTGRGWSSCMAADGCYREQVPAIIGSMTLIAYLINENDPEINNPLGRILLKPCDNREVVGKKSRHHARYFKTIRQHFNHLSLCLTTKEEPLQDSSIAFAMGSIYGLGAASFRGSVAHFCENNLHDLEEGTYRLHGKVYADGLAAEHYVGEDKIFQQRPF